MGPALAARPVWAHVTSPNNEFSVCDERSRNSLFLHVIFWQGPYRSLNPEHLNKETQNWEEIWISEN